MEKDSQPDLAQGSDAAELFRAYSVYVARFLTRLGVPAKSELDDLVQEVFLVVHRRGGYKQGPAHPKTWLAEIALRVLSEARRRQRRRPADTNEEAILMAPAGGESPFDATIRVERVQRVEDVLDAFDSGHRAVFLLFELEGQSCEAIAEGLSIPIGTVYSRLNAVRSRLRRDYRLRELMDIGPLRVDQPARDPS